MSDRMIRVQTCRSCPHWDHKGAFGEIAYIPRCQKMSGRELPYTVERGFGNHLQAVASPDIPDWCPLELAPEV